MNKILKKSLLLASFASTVLLMNACGKKKSALDICLSNGAKEYAQFYNRIDDNAVLDVKEKSFGELFASNSQATFSKKNDFFTYVSFAGDNPGEYNHMILSANGSIIEYTDNLSNGDISYETQLNGTYSLFRYIDSSNKTHLYDSYGTLLYSGEGHDFMGVTSTVLSYDSYFERGIEYKKIKAVQTLVFIDTGSGEIVPKCYSLEYILDKTNLVYVLYEREAIESDKINDYVSASEDFDLYYFDDLYYSKSYNVYKSSSHLYFTDENDEFHSTIYVPTSSICLGDNIIYQERIPLNPDAKDYDYEKDGNKYQLLTTIYDIKNDEVKNVKCDYIFENVSPIYETNPKDCEKYYANYAICDFYKIENKKISLDLTVGCLFDSNLNMVSNDVEKIGILTSISDDLFLYETKFDTYLCDGSKKLTEWNNFDIIACYADAKVLLVSDGLHYGLADFNLKLLTNGFEYTSYNLKFGNNTILFTKPLGKNELVTITDGNYTKLDVSGRVSYSSNVSSFTNAEAGDTFFLYSNASSQTEKCYYYFVYNKDNTNNQIVIYDIYGKRLGSFDGVKSVKVTKIFNNDIYLTITSENGGVTSYDYLMSH